VSLQCHAMLAAAGTVLRTHQVVVARCVAASFAHHSLIHATIRATFDSRPSMLHANATAAQDSPADLIRIEVRVFCGRARAQTGGEIDISLPSTRGIRHPMTPIENPWRVATELAASNATPFLSSGHNSPASVGSVLGHRKEWMAQCSLNPTTRLQLAAPPTPHSHGACGDERALCRWTTVRSRLCAATVFTAKVRLKGDARPRPRPSCEL